jgi:hypothetical protein
MDLRQPDRPVTMLIAWCPRLNQPATNCKRDGCTHYMVDVPVKEDA